MVDYDNIESIVEARIPWLRRELDEGINVLKNIDLIDTMFDRSYSFTYRLKYYDKIIDIIDYNAKHL